MNKCTAVSLCAKFTKVLDFAVEILHGIAFILAHLRTKRTQAVQLLHHKNLNNKACKEVKLNYPPFEVFARERGLG